MNQLMDNLLKIDEKMHSNDFVFIKINIENLDESKESYKKIVAMTQKIIDVMNAFSYIKKEDYR